MNSLSNFITRRRRRRIEPSHQLQQEQARNMTCFILELPAELILYLSDFLEPSNYMIFSHTCRSIYIILGMQPISVCHNSDARYIHWQRIKYLSLLSKDLPDYWACESCMTLHTVDKRDLPSTPRNFFCHRRLGRLVGRVYNEQFAAGSHFLSLEHQHVQLALKYTRIKDSKYNAYLRALLTPYDARRFPHMNLFWKTLFSTLFPFFETSSVIYPKIVSDPDGTLRFLVSFIWTYKTTQDVSMPLMNMGELAICPHTHFRSGRVFYYICEYGPVIQDVRGSAVRTVQRYRYGATEALTGSCSRCPTDFALQVTRQCVEIRVWRDMGTEGSPVDLPWRVNTMVFDPQQDRDCLNDTFPYTPGSVRERFDAGQDLELQQPSVWEHIINQIRGFWALIPAALPLTID
ncbi:hypothetical protein F4814DRAFT_168128 [Daldinia grandis]|nr:hypothetical protein F4814DRAFT_168128 [Daldinia grandis]